MKKLWLIVPCYNEEEMLPTTYEQLTAKLDALVTAGRISPESRLAFINDGSTDRTWELIEDYHKKDERVVGICLSRNKGHQHALLAGLLEARPYADLTVSLDADLQDDIHAIDLMLDEADRGASIVYGVRSSRKEDSFFKRFTAEAFYKFMKKMGADTVFNHADFRLMDKKALDAFAEYGEANLFLRGIVTEIGLKTAIVTYERKNREKGSSKYPLKKMMELAETGITSFSVKPLKCAFTFGVITALLTLITLVTGILAAVFPWKIPYSLFFICAAIFGTGTLILFSMQVLGLYIGRIYMETKHRPRYIVSEFLMK